MDKLTSVGKINNNKWKLMVREMTIKENRILYARVGIQM
jgi:hypothetical protein